MTRKRVVEQMLYGPHKGSTEFTDLSREALNKQV